MQLNWRLLLISVCVSLVVFGLGILTFFFGLGRDSWPHSLLSVLALVSLYSDLINKPDWLGYNVCYMQLSSLQVILFL